MPFDPHCVDRTALAEQIREAERKEEALYAQLGRKAFLQLLREPGDFAPELDAICLLKEEAATCKAVLAAVSEETAVCPGCGRAVPAALGTCPICGGDLPKAEPEAAPVSAAPAEAEQPKNPDGPVCPECGKHLRSGVRFCNNCGHPMERPV